MRLLSVLSAACVPLLLLAACAAGLAKKADVFGELTRGAENGIKSLGRLLGTLCALLCAVYMLRASGLFDTLSHLLSPVLGLFGVPGELAPLMLLRPFTGSGALAAASDIIRSSGADSLAGRMAAVMLASGETTLYTAGIYLGAAGVKKSRFALVASFTAEFTALAASALLVNLMWGA